jgi:hypothetical protein
MNNSAAPPRMGGMGKSSGPIKATVGMGAGLKEVDGLFRVESLASTDSTPGLGDLSEPDMHLISPK